MAFKSKAAYLAYHRQWRAKNPDKVKAAQQRHHLLHPEKWRARHRKHRYGITQEEFDAMKHAQGGICAICGLPPEQTPRGILLVDHDHVTKRVRALLCNGCNVAVALLREDATIARALAAYLEQHKAAAA